jgi:hypothetical protein
MEGAGRVSSTCGRAEVMAVRQGLRHLATYFLFRMASILREENVAQSYQQGIFLDLRELPKSTL